ncbi:MAG TPA: RNA-guided pseudouridylation complex pseudouridine synthase subunit Cbf5 [Candidatus Methanomethylophilaceae archaeon]|nr:RNA-guided pseudouridylation complex pseudouridine synthase subunit Cbf5 [Candidatus Methanomethylophilaceae archaeon]
MITKAEDPVPNRWGKKPSDRSLAELLRNGVIVLDKPVGPTSHQVTSWARDILHVKQISHGGTLDPNVSGVLPLCLGKAVRLTDLLLSSNKEYVCIMRLHRDRDREAVAKVMEEFTGRIYQYPPLRSAVKRKLRIRTVHSIELLDMEGRDVLFHVSCDAGTYIRTLCIDMGEALGVGANMIELRRTRSGAMSEDMAVTLQQLKDAYELWQERGRSEPLMSILRPAETLVSHLPRVIIKTAAVDAVCHGADLAVPGVGAFDESIGKMDQVAMLTSRGELVAIGVAQMSAKRLAEASKGVAVSTERVLMERGTYPRMWKFGTDL